MLSRQLIRAEPDLLKARAAQAGRNSVPRVPSRGHDDRSIVPATAIGAQRVLALQRSVGNRAVGHLLSCRERATLTYGLVGRTAAARLDRRPVCGATDCNVTSKAVDDTTDASDTTSAEHAPSTAGDVPAGSAEPGGVAPDALPAEGPNAAGAPAGGPACGAVPTFEVKKVAPLSPGLSDDRWGLTQPESVTVTITACRQGASWVPDVTNLVGNYSIQTRLLPVQTEVTGPGGNTSQEKFCEQARALDGLGKDKQSPNGVAPWFMLAAVDRHEQVHEAHLLPALKMAVGQIVRAVKQVSIPDDGTLDADAATKAIEATPAYQKAVKEAKVIWDLMLFDLVLDDHFSGATEKAEREVIDPMIKAICDEARKQSWGPCSSCPP